MQQTTQDSQLWITVYTGATTSELSSWSRMVQGWTLFCCCEHDANGAGCGSWSTVHQSAAACNVRMIANGRTLFCRLTGGQKGSSPVCLQNGKFGFEHNQAIMSCLELLAEHEKIVASFTNTAEAPRHTRSNALNNKGDESIFTNAAHASWPYQRHDGPTKGS